MIIQEGIMRRFIIGCTAALLGASPAAAEVKSAEDNGFSIVWAATVAAPPDRIWAELGQVGHWWNPAHSWSGEATNLSLTPVETRHSGVEVGEKLSKSKGSVEHLRVVFADPERLLRLTGGLGPLQSMAVSGVMDWGMKPVAGGTELTLRYTVSGAISGGGKALAPAVDGVLGEQFKRLTAVVGKK